MNPKAAPAAKKFVLLHVHIPTFSYLCAAKSHKDCLAPLRKDGRVVDYTGLENRRTETCRGFESLSFRKELSSMMIIVGLFFYAKY